MLTLPMTLLNRATLRLMAWVLRAVVEELVKSAGLDLDKAVCAYLSGSTVEEARGVTAPPITTYIFYKCLRDRGIELRGNITRKVEVPEDAGEISF